MVDFNKLSLSPNLKKAPSICRTSPRPDSLRTLIWLEEVCTRYRQGGSTVCRETSKNHLEKKISLLLLYLMFLAHFGVLWEKLQDQYMKTIFFLAQMPCLAASIIACQTASKSHNRERVKQGMPDLSLAQNLFLHKAMVLIKSEHTVPVYVCVCMFHDLLHFFLHLIVWPVQ